MKIILAIFSTLAVASGFVPVHPMATRQTTTLQMSEGLKTGYVKWFDTAKGFGFIVPDDGSGDIFVHQTAINVQGFRSLAEDERVEFRTEADQNGRIRALDVTGPDGADVKGAPYPSNNDFDEW